MTKRGRRGEPIRFGHGKLVLAAMVDVHGTDERSSAGEAVAVQWAMALVTRTYDKDNSREREVREALVRAIHG